MTVPSAATKSYAACCTSAGATAAKTKPKGSLVILPTVVGRSDSGKCLSMTWVAPKDLRKPAFLMEAVVMMGLKPDSLASWMATTDGREIILVTQRKIAQFQVGTNLVGLPPKHLQQ